MNDNKSDGLTESLNLLKELQNKLHITGPKNHNRNKTQYYEPASPTLNPFQNQHSLREHPTSSEFLLNIGADNKKLPKNRSLKKNTITSLPIMQEQNQNEYETVKEVLRENRKLKKYVNCLLQMNDYLKNQLIQRDEWGAKRGTVQMNGHGMGHSFELQLMKMEVEYLKQINREKEIELKRSIYLGSKSLSTPKTTNKSKSKTSKKRPNSKPPTPLSYYKYSRSEIPHKKQLHHFDQQAIHHHRSMSNQFSNDNCMEKKNLTPQLPQHSSQIFMKDVLKNKLFNKPPPQDKKCNCNNSQTVSKFKKAYKQGKYTKNQCRLCYL